ncbi:MAG: GTPase Era [Caldimicrobium sp.]|nr:GTPase Era [Caldimicrobium sp.]MCX7613793.1 GTPase Era [Caldimicrobium sp.]MDW8182620.1 GTPase Era [Caldimicrobium sp.]
MTDQINTKSGIVAIIGLPNVGKSTLLNNLLGTKVSIVSSKPQTTRFNIRGIYTRENLQIIFVDTPGIHDAKSLFNKLMVKSALQALEEVDAILWVVDVADRRSEEQWILDLIKKTSKPTLLILNKIDLLRDKRELLPVIDQFAKLNLFEAIIPVSGLKSDGLDIIINELEKILPEGPFYYDPDYVTDLPLKLQVAEIIREKVFMLTYQEVPYSVAVKVESIKEIPEKKVLHIEATIFVERSSQKGIIIGKGGQMLKKIGTLAREELEHLLKRKIFLDLWVKALEGWRERESHLRRLGIPLV